MTLAEFLQQLVASAKAASNGKSVSFVLTQITGDPNIEHRGQVWIGQGYFHLSSDGQKLEETVQLSDTIHDTTDPFPSSYPASVSLDVNSGALTVYPVGGFGGIYANHLQFQYFNGILI